jgi:hypothetical protein
MGLKLNVQSQVTAIKAIMKIRVKGFIIMCPENKRVDLACFRSDQVTGQILQA